MANPNKTSDTTTEINPEAGYAVPMTIGIFLVGVVLAALIVTSGRNINILAETREHARNAARAGAQAIDRDSLYADGIFILDPAEAEAFAQNYLAAVGATGTVTIYEDTITVIVTQDVTSASLLGGGTRTFTAEASATAVEGVLVGNG